MIRPGIFIAISMVSLIPLRAQHPEEESDNNLRYQKVVQCEGKAKETLLQNLEKAIYKIYDSASVQTNGEDEIVIESDVKIYNTVIGKIGNPAGQVSFRLLMEVKNDKYRYTASNFYFTPIKRDRYGRFSLTKQEPVLVNDENYSNDKILLKKIKKHVWIYMDKLENRLLGYMTHFENQKTDW